MFLKVILHLRVGDNFPGQILGNWTLSTPAAAAAAAATTSHVQPISEETSLAGQIQVSLYENIPEEDLTRSGQIVHNPVTTDVGV